MRRRRGLTELLTVGPLEGSTRRSRGRRRARRARWSHVRAAARTRAWAAATATGQPTCAKQGRSFTSLPRYSTRCRTQAALGEPSASSGPLASMPWRHSTPSLAARAATTGFTSVERISTGSPDRRIAATPIPSPRCTATRSVPSAASHARSSVWVPSKSRTTASTSPGRRAFRGIEQRRERAGALEVCGLVDLEHPGRDRSGPPRSGRRSGGRAWRSRRRASRRPRRSPATPAPGPGGAGVRPRGG